MDTEASNASLKVGDILLFDGTSSEKGREVVYYKIFIKSSKDQLFKLVGLCLDFSSNKSFKLFTAIFTNF